VNQNLSKFLQENGVVHELTCVDTPQQNGVAERKNRHILEVTKALLSKCHQMCLYWLCPTKKSTNVIILKVVKFIFPKMSPSMKQSLSLGDRHFIKEKLDDGLIATEYIPSRLQLADMFTKGLPTKQFKDLTCKLGMIDRHSPT